MFRAIIHLSMLVMIAITSFYQPTVVAATLDEGRSITIPVKVILIGLDQVDTTYLSWSGLVGENLPSSISNTVLLSGNSTGVFFHPQYTFVSAPSAYKQDLMNYLQSIETTVEGRDPWFQRYREDKENPSYFVSNFAYMKYIVYDANSVEDWFWDHSQELGGFPSNGWTLIFTYLPELPSITWSDVKSFEKTNGDQLPKSKPHYYGISSVDSDLGYTSRYRDFMNAWGGHRRMWFVDLSAGPVFNSKWEDLPLQVVLGDSNIDLTTAFGKNWLTEYVSDYVAQATYNFVTPSFIYDPVYKANYRIDVSIIDDRTDAERNEVSIERTVQKQPIEDALKDLVPYSTVVVNLNFRKFDQHLHDLIKSSYKYADSWIFGGVFGEPQRYGVVDLRPLYKYFQDNMADFTASSTSADTRVIPVFAFALSNQTYFTYSYKWYIGKTDWETGALLGISLEDAAFISLNQWEFTRGGSVDPPQRGKGIGFTETIIHEVGHEFGLMHPHQYGNIGDFIFSAMGYFTNDYRFGQIDKDALQRVHADQLFMTTDTARAGNALSEANTAYTQMDYAKAVQVLLTAPRIAEKGTTSGTQTERPVELAVVYLVAAVVAGFALGLLAVMVKRKFAPRFLSRTTQLLIGASGGV